MTVPRVVPLSDTLFRGNPFKSRPKNGSKYSRVSITQQVYLATMPPIQAKTPARTAQTCTHMGRKHAEDNAVLVQIFSLVLKILRRGLVLHLCACISYLQYCIHKIKVGSYWTLLNFNQNRVVLTRNNLELIIAAADFYLSNKYAEFFNKTLTY